MDSNYNQIVSLIWAPPGCFAGANKRCRRAGTEGAEGDGP